MKKLLQKTFFVILIAVAICTPLHFFGQGGAVVLKINTMLAAVDTNSAVTGLKGAAEGTGLISNTNPIELAGTIVKTLLGFLGIVFIVLLLYGGGMRMFSQGEAGKVKASTDIIKSAIIGVFIIFASYIITAFVLTKVSETVEGGGGGGGTAGGNNGNNTGGIIQCCVNGNVCGSPSPAAGHGLYCPFSGFSSETRPCSEIFTCITNASIYMPCITDIDCDPNSSETCQEVSNPGSGDYGTRCAP